MLNGAPEATRQIGDNCNEPSRRGSVERSGKDETMPAIEQTACAFSAEVSGNKCVRSVYDTIVDQTRQRIAGAKSES